MSVIKNNKTYGIRVKVEEIAPTLTTLNATANGTYTPTSPYNGYSSVTVNVSGGGDNDYDTWIFENISGETADLTINGLYKNGSYSLDEGVTWIDLPSDSDGWSTTMDHKINFDNIVYVKYNDVVREYNIFMFTCNKRYNLSGDLYKSYKPYMYSHAFDFNENLIDASGLVFHSDTAGFHSLDRMFNGCISLTTAPAILPATKLWNDCYNSMFFNCTALTTAPALPATTLADSCYSDMFYYCKSLTTAPELPATTLADECYRDMFKGCASLTQAPALPAATLADRCYESMFQGCTSLTTAPELPATTLADICYKDMFQGCTSLTTAPVLPATTLNYICYMSMFSNCTSLTTAPALPATTLADSCYACMFAGCTSLTTAPELLATTLTRNCYLEMFSRCTNLNSVTSYATDGTTDYLTDWLLNVSATGDFYNLGGASYSSGASGIPEGWTEHTSL